MVRFNRHNQIIFDPRPTPCERLAKLLTEQGYTLHADDIEPVQGRWRNRTGGDGTRWWARMKDANGMVWSVNGYHTVTECVKFGVELVRDETGWYHFNAYAKVKTNETTHL